MLKDFKTSILEQFVALDILLVSMLVLVIYACRQNSSDISLLENCTPFLS